MNIHISPIAKNMQYCCVKNNLPLGLIPLIPSIKEQPAKVIKHSNNSTLFPQVKMIKLVHQKQLQILLWQNFHTNLSLHLTFQNLINHGAMQQEMVNNLIGPILNHVWNVPMHVVLQNFRYIINTTASHQSGRYCCSPPSSKEVRGQSSDLFFQLVKWQLRSRR